MRGGSAGQLTLSDAELTSAELTSLQGRIDQDVFPSGITTMLGWAVRSYRFNRDAFLGQPNEAWELVYGLCQFYAEFSRALFERGKLEITPEVQELIGGMTPLYKACLDRGLAKTVSNDTLERLKKRIFGHGK